MIRLLDANVLIALADLDHVHAASALRFFEQTAVRHGWATCPLTENAFLRIVGGASYPGGPGTTGEARRMLHSLRGAPGHQFWPDTVSLVDSKVFPDLPAAKDLTDTYLLGLAVKNGGRLATFDRHFDPARIPGGAQALEILA